MKSISFFSESIPFPLKDPATLQRWLKKVAREGGRSIAQLQFIFCDDRYLLAINQTHLGHDTLTDVITFDYSGESQLLEGDIYISIETVRSNAKALGTPFPQELCRVMVHGMLHLMGYDDQAPSDKLRMRAEEDRCLAMAEVAPYRSPF